MKINKNETPTKKVTFVKKKQHIVTLLKKFNQIKVLKYFFVLFVVEIESLPERLKCW